MIETAYNNILAASTSYAKLTRFYNHAQTTIQKIKILAIGLIASISLLLTIPTIFYVDNAFTRVVNYFFPDPAALTSPQEQSSSQKSGQRPREYYIKGKSNNKVSDRGIIVSELQEQGEKPNVHWCSQRTDSNGYNGEETTGIMLSYNSETGEITNHWK